VSSFLTSIPLYCNDLLLTDSYSSPPRPASLFFVTSLNSFHPESIGLFCIRDHIMTGKKKSCVVLRERGRERKKPRCICGCCLVYVDGHYYLHCLPTNLTDHPILFSTQHILYLSKTEREKRWDECLWAPDTILSQLCVFSYFYVVWIFMLPIFPFFSLFFFSFFLPLLFSSFSLDMSTLWLSFTWCSRRSEQNRGVLVVFFLLLFIFLSFSFHFIYLDKSILPFPW